LFVQDSKQIEHVDSYQEQKNKKNKKPLKGLTINIQGVFIAVDYNSTSKTYKAQRRTSVSTFCGRGSGISDRSGPTLGRITTWT